MLIFYINDIKELSRFVKSRRTIIQFKLS